MKGLITVIAVLVVLGAGFLLISTPSASTSEMTAAEVTQVQTEVAAVADQLMTGLNTLDPSVAGAVYDPEEMHGNDGATYFATYDEWVAHNQDFFARFEELDGGWTNTRIDALSRDAAVFTGQNEMTVTQVTGDHTRIEGFITLVLKKKNGEWKIIVQASNGRWTPIEAG